MRINKRTEVGIKAIGVLRTKGTPTKTKVLSDEISTTVSFLEQVMCELSKAGIVFVKRGKSGGYVINPDYQEITAYNVASALGQEFNIYLSGPPTNSTERLNYEITEAFLRTKI